MTFQVGDVVVCVDVASPSVRITMSAADHARVRAFLVCGRAYEISEIAELGLLRLVGDPWPANSRGGYGPKRFRKIEAADEQFTASIRACRDAHSPAPVA